jgi:ZIP family zinc transporter
MNQYLTVVLIAALPAFGNMIGGLLAELVHITERGLSLALHGAAGVVLAVVGVQLMPRALAAHRPWIVILAFIAGGGLFMLADQGMSIVKGRLPGAESAASSWLIFFGSAVDLFSDGLMIGAGAIIAPSLGLLLALGQIAADIPEGFATMASFKRQAVARRTRLLLSASFVIPVLLGAIIGYGVLLGQPQIVKLALLAFTAGMLITVTVEEIIPEAHKEEKEARLAALVFVGGFALFTMLSAYFE